MPTETDADKFDCELYRLISRAHEFGKTSKKWREVQFLLSKARIPVREMMSTKDRAAAPN
jgi:hypothetical protein